MAFSQRREMPSNERGQKLLVWSNFVFTEKCAIIVVGGNRMEISEVRKIGSLQELQKKIEAVVKRQVTEPANGSRIYNVCGFSFCYRYLISREGK